MPSAKTMRKGLRLVLLSIPIHDQPLNGRWLKYANDPFFCVQFTSFQFCDSSLHLCAFSREFDAINQCRVQYRSSWFLVCTNKNDSFSFFKNNNNTNSSSSILIFFCFVLIKSDCHLNECCYCEEFSNQVSQFIQVRGKRHRGLHYGCIVSIPLEHNFFSFLFLYKVKEEEENHCCSGSVLKEFLQ